MTGPTLVTGDTPAPEELVKGPEVEELGGTIEGDPIPLDQLYFIGALYSNLINVYLTANIQPPVEAVLMRSMALRLIPFVEEEGKLDFSDQE